MGEISPLWCNVALHGLELALVNSVPRKCKVAVIRYPDDLVVLCDNLEILLLLRERADVWLADMGLQLKPSKTRVTHTLHEHEGNVGFDFLGFHFHKLRSKRANKLLPYI